MTSAEEIKSRLDIVDVLSEYIPLKPAGANWRGRCPFHEEKTPSFMVSKPKQIWHCFGCGEGGDMFSFIMKLEGLEFPDALRLLGVKAGVVVKTEAPERRTERERIGRVMAMSVAFWKQQLWEAPEARTAREYLQNERHILPNTIRDWHLGFAVNSWDALTTHLAAQGVSEGDMVSAGVAVRKAAATGRSVYDRFRNRIMFPLMNAHGQVVGATGRILPGTEVNENGVAEAKYVNTPETLLYKKGEVLYGLDQAKQAIRQQQMAVIVEGNVDVVTSHQAGIQHVIAASGTALTAEHVRLLKRYTNRVAFAFDSDTAGESASLRGVVTALEGGLDVLRIVLPKRADGSAYKDPDECIRDNPQLWTAATAAARPFLDDLLERATTLRDLRNINEKRAVITEFMTLLKRIPDSVVVAHYRQELAQRVGVSDAELTAELRQAKTVRDRPHAAPQTNPKVAIDPKRRLSERLLAGIIAAPELSSYAFDVLAPEYLDQTVQALYKEMTLFYTTNSNQPIIWLGESFAKHLSELQGGAALAEQLDVLSLLFDHSMGDGEPDELRRDVTEAVRLLKRHFLRERSEELARRIAALERLPDKDEQTLKDLLTEFQRVSSSLTHLES